MSPFSPLIGGCRFRPRQPGLLKRSNPVGLGLLEESNTPGKRYPSLGSENKLQVPVAASPLNGRGSRGR
jgi:hypothetical protein